MAKAPSKTTKLPSSGRATRLDASLIGDSGLRQYGGFVREEFLTELVGEKGRQKFREMAENDSVCGAVLFAISMLIKNVEWHVKAASDDNAGMAAKEFVESTMEDMDMGWHSVIDEVCSQFTYGFAPMEVAWKVRGGPEEMPGRRSKFTDGYIAPRAISLRGQNSIQRWMIDPDDSSIDGLVQMKQNGQTVEIPIDRLLLFRTTEAKNNPEGQSVLRRAYRAWYFKKKLEEIEAIGVERDLSGIPLVRIPSAYMATNATPADKRVYQRYQELAKTVRQDQQMGIVMPSDRDPKGHLLYEIELMNTGSSRRVDSNVIIERYERRIAMSAMAEFLFLGSTSAGSFALSSDKTSLFASAIGGFLRGICDVLNRHHLPRMWRLNGFPIETMPHLAPGDIEEPNLADLAAFITSLAGAGAPLFPDEDLENKLRRLASLPPVPEDRDEMLEEEAIAEEEKARRDLEAQTASQIAVAEAKAGAAAAAKPPAKKSPTRKTKRSN